MTFTASHWRSYFCLIAACLLIARGARSDNQANEAVFDDFSQGNRTIAGLSNPPLWHTITGAHQAQLFQALSFPNNQSLQLKVDPSAESARTILNVSQADPAVFNNSYWITVTPAGYLGGNYWTSGNFMVISGVLGSVGSFVNGRFGTFINQITANQAALVGSPVSGMQFTTALPHGLQTGDWVVVDNCITNPSVNQAGYQITRIDATTLILNGAASTPLCNNGTELFDDSHIALANLPYQGGAYSSGGQAKRLGQGFDFGIVTAPHAAADSAFTMSGAWNADFNRFSWDMICDNTSIHSNNPGDRQFNLGTYVNDYSQGSGGQGAHYYHWFWPNQYANQVTRFHATRKATHTTSSLQTVFTDDYSFYTPLSGPVHVFDGFGDFYFQVSPGAAEPEWDAFTCNFYNFRFWRDELNADSYVGNLATNWHATNGSDGVYEVSWLSPANIPNGASFEIRYSAAGSCQGSAWTGCTSGGTAVGPSGVAGVYGGTLWTSPALPQAGAFYVGIRPTYAIGSATGDVGKPVIVTPIAGHDVHTGDTVHVTGLGAIGVADGDYQATAVAPQFWESGTPLAGLSQLTSLTSDGVTGSATTALPHGLTPGRQVAVIGSAGQAMDSDSDYGSVITAAGSTSLSWATSAACGSNCVNAAGAHMHTYLTSLRAVQLNGTSGNGRSYLCSGACATLLPVTPVRASEVCLGAACPDAPPAPILPAPGPPPGGPSGPGTPTTTTSLSTGVSAVRVYPNPWRSDKHATRSITFSPLPDGSQIKIFTASGHKVKDLGKAGGQASWDLTNDKGDKVASGMYLYVVTDTQGNKAKGKVGVIR